jgi:hypothetical protein
MEFVFVLFASSCVDSCLTTGRSPVQGVPLTVYRIKKLKRQPRPYTRPVEPVTILFSDTLNLHCFGRNPGEVSNPHERKSQITGLHTSPFSVGSY